MTSARGLPAGIGDPGPSDWHRLDPLTRFVISIATVVAAIALGGILCPLALLVVAVLLPAARAGVLAEVLRLAAVLALPLGISAAIVNILFTPSGTDPLAQLGPITITGEGVRVATETIARIAVMAGAVTLLYLTTRPSALVASLQAHGLSPRLAFVVHNAVAMIPRLAERAAAVAEAQRARGLDTDANILARARGLLAVSAPTVLGAITEVETRALALETRGFTTAGPHTLLWAPSDSRTQRVARWSAVGAVVALIVARLVGVPLPC